MERGRGLWSRRLEGCFQMEETRLALKIHTLFRIVCRELRFTCGEDPLDDDLLKTLHRFYQYASRPILNGSPQNFRNRPLFLPHRQESSLPRHPQGPTFRLSIPSTILQTLDRFSVAVVAPTSRLSKTSRWPQGAPSRCESPDLPPHK